MYQMGILALLPTIVLRSSPQRRQHGGGGGGVAILFTDVCIPSTQSSSCSKNIC